MLGRSQTVDVSSPPGGNQSQKRPFFDLMLSNASTSALSSRAAKRSLPDRATEALLNASAGTDARIVITGASSGIGQEIAQQLLSALAADQHVRAS